MKALTCMLAFCRNVSHTKPRNYSRPRCLGERTPDSVKIAVASRQWDLVSRLRVSDGAGGRGERKNQSCAFSLHRTTRRSHYADHSDCMLTYHNTRAFMEV